MAVQIQQLTKTFGKQKAIDNISFKANEGEIVGFLGPNGAGKSTTMKIATTFLPPTHGTVKVYDYDVVEQPLAIRRILGYLPEHNPLYTDMYVHEYLNFIGSLYNLKGRKLRERIKNIVELCGLTIEQNKKIEALSKGFRQRVGLAQALIHDPKVLILDEPTTGLDPNQIIEIRNLIKVISKQKIVILSTHIMQEVQALCDRVVIINKGKIVADNSVSALQTGLGDHQVLVLEFSGDADMGPFEEMKEVIEVREINTYQFQLKVMPEKDIRSEIFRIASEYNLPLVGLKKEENTIEKVFQQLTRK